MLAFRMRVHEITGAQEVRALRMGFGLRDPVDRCSNKLAHCAAERLRAQLSDADSCRMGSLKSFTVCSYS